jgi:hypothetical protein
MVVSAAKLQANRRNAQKSTGPRTDEGKQKSSLNALEHGCRAMTLVLPEEDPQVLEARHAAWSARFLPRDEPEAYYLQDAVVSSWMLDRARRAQTARLTTNILDYAEERDKAIAKEVAELGRRLFKDRIGPLAFYPSSRLGRSFAFDRKPSTSFGADGEDPDPPEDLVLDLQSTLLGCEWMLGEWARLKAILDKGQAWLSSDKLKAVRLLGKQPFDALDAQDAAMVFMASFVLDPDAATWDWEIGIELAQEDLMRFRSNAAIRELDSLKPADARRAREALLSIIERATEPLELKVEVHRERARIDADLAADRLAFDDTAGGERLRRYELASSRAMSRSLDKVLRLVSGPLSVVSCGDETIAEQDASNEAAELVGGPLPVVSDEVEIFAEQNAPNEPTAPWTTDNSPDRVNVGRIGDPSHGEFVAGGRPEGGDGIEPAVGASDNIDEDRELETAEVEPETREERINRWFRKECERVRKSRVERMRKRSEGARKEPEEARASRHSRPGAPKSDKPVARPKQRVAPTEHAAK